MLGEPIRDRRAERHEATRAEILDAAWAIAREEGLGAIALREVARRIGMQAPSLYSYFRSKNDVYDAMFQQSWAAWLELVESIDPGLSATPREALRQRTGEFFEFAVSDPPRYQLMSLRTIPGFQPSAAAYAPSVESLERTTTFLKSIGVREPAALDMYTALISGLVNQQLANDPGGDRWGRLLDRVIDMYSDAMGIPADQPRRTRTASRRKR